MYSPCDTACAVGFPIRKSSDQSLLAAPRCLSQRATSFIASQCQGIHQMPFSRSIAKPSCTESKTPKHSTRQHNTLTRRHFPLSIWSCNQTPFIRVFENYKTSQCQRSRQVSPSPPANRCRIRLSLVTATRQPSDDGGARRDRTDDLMLAKHALSQLSYGPDCLWQALKRRAATSVALARCAEAPRGLNGPVGFVLTNAKGIWWARADSNCRPHAYQACALTT
jgi:hypothetical protein